jgi:probable F420-dependent oxidoreductase
VPGYGRVAPISCPDNVAFDSHGNLWIATDGNALGSNDGLFAVALEGPNRGETKQFLTCRGAPRRAAQSSPTIWSLYACSTLANTTRTASTTRGRGGQRAATEQRGRRSLRCGRTTARSADERSREEQNHSLGFEFVPHPIRIGVQLQPQHSPSYDNIRDAVRRCEDIGVDVAYNWDHFYPLYGEPDGPHFECWTMLGAWAEQTSRIEFGALVTCNSYRNPELLADMARTTDHISGGRLILGIGSGWFQRDYDEYGYDFGTAGGRLNELAEALPRIKSRFAKLNPAPTRDIPILIGGTGEKKTLRMVAEYASIWHGFVDRESYPHKAQVLSQHCEAVGRDPADIERSAGVQSRGDALLADADAMLELGVTQFTVGVTGPDYDLSSAEALCRWRDSRSS